jgi:phage N-6-adenine-methyltransferase
VRDYRQERTTRAASRPLRITGICINCLRGYATVATGSERPPACHDCGEPVRELLKPLAGARRSMIPTAKTSSTTGVLWTGGMMSSLREDWATPERLFRVLDAEFHFDLDVCADPTNAKCKAYITRDQDALSTAWGRLTCWMNPPYGRKIGDWIAKAYRASQSGSTVVCLIPARTDTSWWHEFCLKGEIRFLRGRLTFDDAKQGRCPFPSAIVVFRPTTLNTPDQLSEVAS